MGGGGEGGGQTDITPPDNRIRTLVRKGVGNMANHDGGGGRTKAGITNILSVPDREVVNIGSALFCASPPRCCVLEIRPKNAFWFLFYRHNQEKEFM